MDPLPYNIHHSPFISSTTPPPNNVLLPLHIIHHSSFISSTTPPPYHPPLPLHIIHHSPALIHEQFLAHKEDQVLSPLILTHVCVCVHVCLYVLARKYLVLFVLYFYSGRTHQLAPPQLSWFWAIFCPVITRTSMWVCVLLTFILIWRGSGGF